MEDEEGLVIAMRKLLSDQSLRNTLVGVYRVKVEKTYTLDAMVSTYDRIYRDAVATRGRRLL